MGQQHGLGQNGGQRNGGIGVTRQGVWPKGRERKCAGKSHHQEMGQMGQDLPAAEGSEQAGKCQTPAQFPHPLPRIMF